MNVHVVTHHYQYNLALTRQAYSLALPFADLTALAVLLLLDSLTYLRATCEVDLWWAYGGYKWLLLSGKMHLIIHTVKHKYVTISYFSGTAVMYSVPLFTKCTPSAIINTPKSPRSSFCNRIKPCNDDSRKYIS
jgi:hypothetical protein